MSARGSTEGKIVVSGLDPGISKVGGGKIWKPKLSMPVYEIMGMGV